MWFQSCSDLLLSRFSPADFLPLSAKHPSARLASVSVTRVARVHNRHLRAAFEAEAEAVGARLHKAGVISQGGAGRAPTEYLFYAAPVALGSGVDEVMRVAEGGFRCAEEVEMDRHASAASLFPPRPTAASPCRPRRDPVEYGAMGLDSAIALTNSLAVADVARCSDALSRGDAVGALRGRIMVAKVLPGMCREDSEAVPITGVDGKGKIQVRGVIVRT